MIFINLLISLDYDAQFLFFVCFNVLFERYLLACECFMLQTCDMLFVNCDNNQFLS